MEILFDSSLGCFDVDLWKLAGSSKREKEKETNTERKTPFGPEGKAVEELRSKAEEEAWEENKQLVADNCLWGRFGFLRLEQIGIEFCASQSWAKWKLCKLAESEWMRSEAVAKHRSE